MEPEPKPKSKPKYKGANRYRSDPEFRERMKAKARENYQKKMQDPEFRRKHNERIKHRRMMDKIALAKQAKQAEQAEQIDDPFHPKFQLPNGYTYAVLNQDAQYLWHWYNRPDATKTEKERILQSISQIMDR